MSTDDLPRWNNDEDDGATTIAPPGDQLLDLLKGREEATQPGMLVDIDRAVGEMTGGRRRMAGKILVGTAVLVAFVLLAVFR